MHLFVVAVTSNFIETRNNARNIEFTYAIDNHIPVLPLLQEENIGKRFNEVCGSMQYIDKYALNMDRTAIPYKEKLKKFLDSVLLSDDVVKKVQKAFDTYIFLSYRKKDRRRAKKVMQSIHQSEEMRDVAIWYDEFLTPGEDFNNEIIDNIIKSKLMAMVVTPSVNEIVQKKKNYIMDKEYPAALRYKKPVLPIEAEETDLKELKDNYDGIPDPVNVEEYNILKNKLKRILFPRGQRQNNDPNHRYLIGLAYLSGLFVEVNRQRALNLITSAAEAGVPEAFEKLFAMYWNGEGVERNYSMALEWQRQYVQLLIKQCQKENTPEALQKLIDNEYIWGDYSREAGKLEMAKVAFRQMGIFAKILDDITGQAKTYIANSYSYLGSVYFLEGNFDEAKKWTVDSLKIHQSLLSKGASVEVLNNICVIYYKMGMINWKNHNFAVAEDCYAKGIEIMEKFAKKTDMPEPMLNLILTYNSLGILFYD
ncbi:MAG: SEL1-like repeat protein, partial [Erysipelotrichaceae bacterium]|nr:SEL1-like repeat protein [Erysipelotrichaceae bacterium]